MTESEVRRRKRHIAQKKPIKHVKRRPLRRDEPTMWVRDGFLVMKLPRKLRSLNQLKSRWSRYGDTQAWERLIRAAKTTENDMSLLPSLATRMKLEVIRAAPRVQYYLDQTNLAGSVKGLEDALVRLGYLVDDSPRWLDGPYVTQKISDDKKYWAFVIVSLAPHAILNKEVDVRLTQERNHEQRVSRVDGQGPQGRHRGNRSKTDVATRKASGTAGRRPTRA